MYYIKSAMKRFLQPFTKNRLVWAVYIVTTRLKYKFNALYSGIELNRNSDANLFNFRRNIHRLEKGLSYQEIKNVFAEDYILETVNYLKASKKQGILDANTLAWGEAVLELYFKVCQHSDTVAAAYKIYQSLKPENSHPDWVPYTSQTRPDLTVQYDAYYQLALRRRSVRFYLDRKVEPEMVEKAMKAAALSPSACNRQAFRFLFFNEPELVYQISQVPGGVAGYTVPSIVVVVGSYQGYFDERDINAPIIDSSLAAMAFVFALETLGLSSVCINWPNLPDREEKIRQLIYLEEDEFVVMLIGIGYPHPEGKIPFSAKRDIKDMILINQRVKSKGD